VCVCGGVGWVGWLGVGRGGLTNKQTPVEKPSTKPALTHPTYSNINKGIVLVAPCYTDLGYLSERRAGWYPPSGGPWRWDDIKRNAGFIMQFSSTNDGCALGGGAH
jgi:hypothetical protein